jgi:hypothetical protein
MKVEDFAPEIAAAVKMYDRYIVCVDKTPEVFLRSIESLMQKAIDVFENRAPGLRHGIALDSHVTIMLSENNGGRPLCGIYFNLHTPHKKKTANPPNPASPSNTQSDHPG